MARAHNRHALEDELPALQSPVDDILALDEVLKKLESQDPRKTQIVMLRFFAGLNMQQIADTLAVSKSSIERDCGHIRPWLYKELDDYSGTRGP